MAEMRGKDPRLVGAHLDKGGQVEGAFGRGGAGRPARRNAGCVLCPAAPSQRTHGHSDAVRGVWLKLSHNFAKVGRGGLLFSLEIASFEAGSVCR